MSEQDNLAELRNAALAEIDGANAVADLDALETKYLGRKGELTLQLRKIGSRKQAPVCRAVSARSAR